jgi:hypothetical protein
MTTTLKLGTQHLVTGSAVCEIWHAGEMIGTIYAAARGVKIVSKYIENTTDLVIIEAAEPPALLVNILP